MECTRLRPQQHLRNSVERKPIKASFSQGIWKKVKKPFFRGSLDEKSKRTAVSFYLGIKLLSTEQALLDTAQGGLQPPGALHRVRKFLNEK